MAAFVAAISSVVPFGYNGVGGRNLSILLVKQHSQACYILLVRFPTLTSGVNDGRYAGNYTRVTRR